MASLIIVLYRILGAVLIWPASLLLFRHPNFRGTLLGRLGLRLPEIPSNRGIIWVHAASVGEVKAVAGLIRELKQDRPDLFVCLSSVTVTGRDVASRLAEIDLVIPFPFDLAWVMKRYMLRLYPQVILVVETELWPNMLLGAESIGIPVVFVNARMTPRSYAGFEKIRSVMRKVLRAVSVLAMAEGDAQRFSRLGAGQVEVLGNLKLDMVGEVDLARKPELRQRLGVGKRPVFIAGSIREGEEAAVIDAIAYAKARIPDLYSIVAPRHPDMLASLKAHAGRTGLGWGLRSTMHEAADLLFVDTFGELFDLYGASDVAFVGGSLKDLGGQNILEPIAWEVPTIHGPHMDNFTWAMEAVEGHTLRVQDVAELGTAVVEAIQDPEKYRTMAHDAREALNTRRGVGRRYVRALEGFL